MALTVKGIKRLTRAGRYSDGGNLFLQVTPSGGRSWLFRYEIAGRQRGMGLGPLEYRTLEEARDLAYAARKQLQDGIDPIEARRAERTAKALEAARAMSFEKAATEYYNGHASQWTNDQYRKKFLASLRMYAFTKIGTLPVAAIDTGLVLKVMEPIWSTKPNTANRVRGRIETILDWATVRGYRTGDNPARWSGHLEEALPAKTTVAKHHAAMPYVDVSDFVARLQQQIGIPPRALEFLILTAARTGEVTGALWSEIDLDNKIWVVPGPRMKEKREHRVPLTDRSIAILKELPREGNFVFIGARKGLPLGRNTFLNLLEAMGHDDVTTHGFRSSFRDWCGESTSFASDICEVALSHVVGGQVITSYQRGDMLEKRRSLMMAWEQFLTLPKREATVVPIRKRP